MFTLYEVIPGPMGETGEGGRVSVEWAWTPPPGEGPKVERFHVHQQLAEKDAKVLCDRVSASNPGPGLRSGKPVDVIVVKRVYATLPDVARGRPSSSVRVALVEGTTWSSNSYADLDDETLKHYRHHP